MKHFNILYVRDEVKNVDGMELLMAISKRLPGYLSPANKADLGQEIALAVIEGKLALEDLDEKLPSFVKSINREYPIKWGPRSLDQPFAHGSDTLLREMI